MATTIRRDATNGKEKKGTSPSSSSPLVKKSPKPSISSPPSSSSLPTSGRSSPTMDRKQVPSYLRHTKSSKILDSPTAPKRSNTDSSTQKPTTTTRRRSFDRPPPVSQVQKAVLGSPGARETRPLRSSSFSPRSTSSSSASPRVAPERQSSLGKGSVRDIRKGETQLSKSRSINRNTLPSKPTPKKDPSSRTSVKKKSPKSLTSESSNECESHSIEHLVSDDDISYTQHDIQSLPEISEMPDSNEELKDPTNQELEAKHVVEEKDDDKVNSVEEQDKTLEDSHEDHHDHEEKPTVEKEEVIEEPAPQELETAEEEYQAVIEKQPEQEIPDEQQTDDNVLQEEVQSAEQNNQAEEGAEEESEAHQEPAKVDPTETLPKEEEEEEEKELPAKEEEKGEEKTEKEKDEKENVRSPSPSSARTAQQPAGKKENQAYNDMIEQTASKLMGKRNKVLALAGAFETVISLQDTSKN